MWSADARSLFYVSDRGGAQNLWVKAVTGTAVPRQLTTFKQGRVLWPSISARGDTIVFERNFGIWKLDTASGKTSEVPIVRIGAPAGPVPERARLTARCARQHGVATATACALLGLDSLLSTAQMPGGIPVATFAIGKAGATNAGLFAVSILANSRPDLKEKLRAFRVEQAEKVKAATLP